MAYYATLYCHNGSKSESFRLYLSADVIGHLPDTDWVKVLANTKHVIIKPTDNGDPAAKHIVTPGGRRFGIISVNKLVSDGFLPRRHFGKRYKVKKDKQGNLYVCLNEPIKEKGEDDNGN